jgi:hypothetical protein
VAPQGTTTFTPLYEGQQCDRLTVVQMEGPLEAVASLTGTGSRATHQAELRMPVQQHTDHLKDLCRKG